jgi:carboxypeptidase C (cathepsin A)
MLDHLGLEPNLRGNLKFVVYPGGHMLYTSTTALAQFTHDVAEFMKKPTD